jgi:hypothetical protein
VGGPAGLFAFEGGLTVPPGAALVGTYATVPNHDLRRSGGVVARDGSQLLPRGGRGDAAGAPFLSLGASAAVRGFTIFYPAQAATAAPVPYPWTIALLDRDSAVMDVELLNSYNGVRVFNAPRFFIARVQGQPTNIGVDVDAVHDIGRIENVHFNPWFSDAPAYVAHQELLGVGFQFARTDWQYATNTFVFGMAVGYRFYESADGVANGNFLGAGADGIANASVLVEAVKPWGVVFTNAELVAKAAWPAGGGAADLAQVVVAPTCNGTVRFANSIFFGPAHAIARLLGTGSTSFDGCVFHQWDADATGRAAVEADAGQVSVRGCEFHKFHAPSSLHLRLGANVTKALFSLNTIDGALSVDTAAAKGAALLVKDNLPDAK